MRIHPLIYGGLVVTLFLGVISGFQRAGIWSVSGKITSEGTAVQPSQTDISTIKGWMTLEQITSTYQVPLADLLTQFDLPADTAPATAIKDLESDVFSVTHLRTWLQSRDGAAGVSGENNPLATPALTALPAPTSTPPMAASRESGADEKILTGKTTFQDLLNWGVSKEAIREVLGADLPAPAMAIKDFVISQGLEFSTVKTRLQTEVDRIQ